MSRLPCSGQPAAAAAGGGGLCATHNVLRGKCHICKECCEFPRRLRSCDPKAHRCRKVCPFVIEVSAFHIYWPRTIWVMDEM